MFSLYPVLREDLQYGREATSLRDWWLLVPVSETYHRPCYLIIVDELGKVLLDNETINDASSIYKL